MAPKPFIVAPKDYASTLDIVGEHVTVLASGEHAPVRSVSVSVRWQRRLRVAPQSLNVCMRRMKCHLGSK